jgi:hypothetical protein
LGGEKLKLRLSLRTRAPPARLVLGIGADQMLRDCLEGSLEVPLVLCDANRRFLEALVLLFRRQLGLFAFEHTI